MGHGVDPPARLVVERLVPEDWEVLRALRLRALDDAPDAFLQRRHLVASWSPQTWRAGFEDGVWAVALRVDESGADERAAGVRAAGLVPVGLARSAREPGSPSVRHLEAVWVDPAHRRRGVATALVRWLVRYERERGGTDIRLWVVEGNDQAVRFYQRLGFVRTGERQPIPQDVGRTEERLRLPVGLVG